MFWYIITSGTVITLSSLSGIVFSWKFMSAWIEPRLRYLIALAAGVFTVVIVSLGNEALHEASPFIALGAFLLGALTIGGITKLVPDTHHHHGTHPEHHHGRIDARRVLLGDAVHNIHDGIVLVPSFLVSLPVGLVTAGAILLHEVVQEISQFFVLREAGYTPKQALVRNLAAQLTLWLGVAVSLFISQIASFTTPLVAFAAGGFFYILVRDLIPSVLHKARTDHAYLSYLFMFITGIVIMTVVSIAAPHENADNVYPLPDGFGLATLGTYDAQRMVPFASLQTG